MSTVIRPEISEDSPYHISKHKYYELKHFCLQYDELKRSYNDLLNSGVHSRTYDILTKNSNISDPTAKTGEMLEKISNKIDLIESAAKECDEYLGNYILKGVTKEYSYDGLKTIYNIPCCKDTYYNLYRRFFWILGKSR